MKKNYQTSTRRAGTTGRVTPRNTKTGPARAGIEASLVLPETVQVALAELAGELQEGLLAHGRGRRQACRSSRR